MGLFGKKKTLEEIIQKAKEKIEEGNRASAIMTLVMQSGKGDGEADYLMGCCYLEDYREKGKKTDGDCARVYLTKAAQMGYSQAARILAREFGITDYVVGDTEEEEEDPERLFAAANQAYNEGDQKRAFSLYRRAAELGHVPASYNLGIMCEKGEGTKANQARANEIFQQAAEQGHLKAQLRCGYDCYMGSNVPMDRTKSYYWFEKAARQGDAGAQRICGLLCRDGDGVPEDREQAKIWFEQAAVQGDADAQQQYALILWYLSDGSWEILTQARDWFEKAAQQGQEGAVRFLEEQAGEIETRLARAAEEKKEREAQEAAARAEAERKEREAQEAAARAEAEQEDRGSDALRSDETYREGQKQFQAGEYAQAAKTFRKLSGKFDGEGDYWIGRSYLEEFRKSGSSGAQKQAKQYLLFAAWDEHQGAARLLAEEYGVNDYLKAPAAEPKEEPKDAPQPEPEPALPDAPGSTQEENGEQAFRNGWDAYLKKDYSTAFRLFQSAAQQGDKNAQSRLGLMYEKGQGTAVDLRKALYWFEQAAQQGDVRAQYVCSMMYYSGRGVAVDQQKARMWMEKAAAQGDSSAKRFLQEHF